MLDSRKEVAKKKNKEEQRREQNRSMKKDFTMDNRDDKITEVSMYKEYRPNLGGTKRLRPEPHGFTTTTETLKEEDEDEENMHGGEREG